jgi:hypothetical protein
LKDHIGATSYSGDWCATDSRWTDDIVGNLPFDIDPRTSAIDGIFIAPFSSFENDDCFFDYQIAHIRDGFVDNFYDAENMDEETHSYYITY